MSDWKSALAGALYTAGSLAKEGLIKTKDLAVAGIEKVQDPEFQQSVKNGASTVVDYGKKVAAADARRACTCTRKRPTPRCTQQ